MLLDYLKSQDKREDMLLDSSLKEEVNKLKVSNTKLREKNKQLVEQLEKKTREVTTLRRLLADKKRTPARIDPNSTLQQIEIKPAPTYRHHKESDASLDNIDNTNENILEIARKYKSRLMEVEEELIRLQEENLRSQGGVPASRSTEVIFLNYISYMSLSFLHFKFSLKTNQWDPLRIVFGIRRKHLTKVSIFNQNQLLKMLRIRELKNNWRYIFLLT